MAKKNVGKWGRVIEGITQPDIAKYNVRIRVFPSEITNLCAAPGDGADWGQEQRLTPDDKKPAEFRQAKDSFTSLNDALTEPGALSKSSSPSRWKKNRSSALESGRDDQGRPDELLKASGSVECPICKKLIEPSRTIQTTRGRVCDRVKNPSCRDMDASKSQYVIRD